MVSPEHHLRSRPFFVSHTSCIRFSRLVRLILAFHSSYRGFKALKQSTKILFLELHRPEEALKTYEELLPYTKVSLVHAISSGLREPDSNPVLTRLIAHVIEHCHEERF